jgi:hypothetical protein
VSLGILDIQAHDLPFYRIASTRVPEHCSGVAFEGAAHAAGAAATAA